MKKERLLHARKKIGYSQQQMSDLMNMDVSNYQRRETGEKSISKDEWEKLAEILSVSVEEIYEPEEKQVFIFKDNKQSYNGINYNYAIPEHLIESQRKYIEKLEKEIEELKKRMGN